MAPLSLSLSLRSLNLPIHSRRAKKILFRGLDSAGKTTLLHMLKDERLAAANAVPPHRKRLRASGEAFGLGGHQIARRVWKDYYCQGKGGHQIARRVWKDYYCQDLRNISIPPPCHVKHLKLSGRSYQAGVLNLDALVDGLLRSCRPETLSIAEAPDIGTKLVKIACWLHCLKDVKIALFSGTDKKALDCHSLLQALPTLTRHHHISFNFRW